MERKRVHAATYRQVPEVFIARFPSLLEPYVLLLDEWDDEIPGPTIVFDDVVAPPLLAMLSTPDEHTATITTMFVMMEEMALHPERDVRSLLSVTLLEHIVNARPMLYEAAIWFTGPATRQELDRLAPRFGITPLPSGMTVIVPPARFPCSAPFDWANDPG